MLRKLEAAKADSGGFSLIELMIAVAIVAILGAVAVPAYFSHVLRSRQSSAVGELMAIKAAEEQYFAVNGGYAGKMNMLSPGEGTAASFMYAVAGTYTNGDYQYWIVPSTNSLITAGTIRAKGDLNHDGHFNDGWEVSIDKLEDKPKPYDTGGTEGLGWSSLGHLFK